LHLATFEIIDTQGMNRLFIGAWAKKERGALFLSLSEQQTFV
jgi:hypothetical protein